MATSRFARPTLLALFLAASGLPASSCDSPDPEACQKISDACHEHDEGAGTGKAHDCHRLSHVDDPTQCTRSLDDCTKYCASLPPVRKDGGSPSTPDASAAGGAGGSGGASGAGGQGGSGGSRDAPTAPDGPAPDTTPAPTPAPADARPADAQPAVSEACVRYCACLTSKCASLADAPPWVKNAALCPARCQMFSARELMCWSGFCDPNAATVSAHNCSHGWGGEGTSECAN
jgi:hypothetical protein